ncbi:hypothetical protein DPMN_006946 [Dreissena polymorpha]|uniref:Uncharacterized protein n=1 Tax=Dreissena polymorpha TaxID=45954 RepID=A0A9D4MV89_DREPO|nr:hypothetical protein DPMN_006946 [Dreissena polymorpha]
MTDDSAQQTNLVDDKEGWHIPVEQKCFDDLRMKSVPGKLVRAINHNTHWNS